MRGWVCEREGKWSWVYQSSPRWVLRLNDTSRTLIWWVRFGTPMRWYGGKFRHYCYKNKPEHYEIVNVFDVDAVEYLPHLFVFCL